MNREWPTWWQIMLPLIAIDIAALIVCYLMYVTRY